MIEDYRSAQRAGQRAYRANVARGQSPYLAVLDDILTDVDIVAQEPLGLVDIPATPSLQSSGRTSVTPIWKRASTPLLLPSNT